MCFEQTDMYVDGLGLPETTAMNTVWYSYSAVNVLQIPTKDIP